MMPLVVFVGGQEYHFRLDDATGSCGGHVHIELYPQMPVLQTQSLALDWFCLCGMWCCFQVLHSDLKVRNVLLKSDASPRGCIAKVADFGLAVKMDCMDTHISAFQVRTTPATRSRLPARSLRAGRTWPGPLMHMPHNQSDAASRTQSVVPAFSHDGAAESMMVPLSRLAYGWISRKLSTAMLLAGGHCGLQGTMSHLAPEALLHGHISKAADVYAMGVTLWELFTGGQAYQGVWKLLLRSTGRFLSLAYA
jgi:serine/threonine protein kinase